MNANDERAFDYAAAEHDVRTRVGLAPEVRAPLIELPRADWSDQPGYAGFPAHFLGIHAELRGVADRLVALLQGVADEPPAARVERWRSTRTGELALGLARAAHHHHDLEEANLFPWLAASHPTFERAMRLLDGDRRVLEETLARLESSAAVPSAEPGAALGAAQDLAKVLERHLSDEEEIAVPALLGMR